MICKMLYQLIKLSGWLISLTLSYLNVCHVLMHITLSQEKLAIMQKYSMKAKRQTTMSFSQMIAHNLTDVDVMLLMDESHIHVELHG